MEAMATLFAMLVLLFLLWIYIDVSKIRSLMEDRKDKE